CAATTAPGSPCSQSASPGSTNPTTDRSSGKEIRSIPATRAMPHTLASRPSTRTSPSPTTSTSCRTCSWAANGSGVRSCSTRTAWSAPPRRPWPACASPPCGRSDSRCPRSQPARARGTTDVAGVPPEQAADLTAAPEAAAAEVPPELVAQTLGEYLRAYGARIRAGESGVLPVIAAMFAIILVFWAISPNHVFLSPVNLVNLFQQAAVFMVLAMAEG